jgi:hypothetical protein
VLPVDFILKVVWSSSVLWILLGGGVKESEFLGSRPNSSFWLASQTFLNHVGRHLDHLTGAAVLVDLVSMLKRLVASQERRRKCESSADDDTSSSVQSSASHCTHPEACKPDVEVSKGAIETKDQTISGYSLFEMLLEGDQFRSFRSETSFRLRPGSSLLYMENNTR